MKLRATVVRVTGKTTHAIGRLQGDQVVESVRLPSPAWVEIVEEDGMYSLNYYTATGRFLTDTCHPTLEEAKDQALFEFDIPPDGWETVG